VITLEPEVIVQGKVLVISLWAVPDLAITGVLDSQELIFMADGHHYWALLGVSVSDEIGIHTVWLTATNDRGQIETATANFHVTGGAFPIERIDLPAGQLQLLDPALVEAENKDLQRRFGVFTTEKLWRGLFMMPIEGPISSAFGTLRSYNGGPVSGHHQGIDIDAPEGSPVVAANDGMIVLAQRLSLRGNAIVIDHGLGVFSGYYHMSEIEVAEGQSVKKGQIIGRVGETGMATGPHLHWEIRIRGTSVAPLEWIEREIGFGKIETNSGV
jgi:murein DD-endopeptidase MepM/ murein hydrolase activator NlpD